MSHGPVKYSWKKDQELKFKKQWEKIIDLTLMEKET